MENQVEVWNDEKVKTEPDEFEDEDKKPLAQPIMLIWVDWVDWGKLRF